jgi:hypothetical protein
LVNVPQGIISGDQTRPDVLECHRGITRFLVRGKLADSWTRLADQVPLGSNSLASNLEVASQLMMVYHNFQKWFVEVERESGELEHESVPTLCEE